MAASYPGIDSEDFGFIVRESDLPVATLFRDAGKLYPKGFWRVDRRDSPETRFTVLALFFINQYLGSDSTGGLSPAVASVQGMFEDWQLPETLRLADYGLGHDERAKEHQPVRECFGPRWYDWQLAQSPEESWRECHLHARNQLGPHGYQALLDEIAGKETAEPSGQPEPQPQSNVAEPHTPLFDRLD